MLLITALLGCRSPPDEPREVAPDAPAPTSSPAAPPPDCGDPSLTIGTGETEFEPYPATDPTADVISMSVSGWFLSVAADLVGVGPVVEWGATVTMLDDGAVIAGDGCPSPQGVDLSVEPANPGLIAGVETACGWQFGGGRAWLTNIDRGDGTTWDAVRRLDGRPAEIAVTAIDLDAPCWTSTSGEECWTDAESQPACPRVSSTVDVTLAITEESFPH